MTAADRIATMPKVEQHLHLEGSIRPATARRLAERHGASFQESTEPEFTDFDGFLRAFLAGLELLRDPEDFADITERLAAELAEQNVRYAEVTSTPFNHHRRGITMDAYTEGLNEGRMRASELGVRIGWILDIPRELEPPSDGFTADYLLGPFAPDGVVGIGLGGPEAGWPAAPFRRSFERVTSAGLAALPHAGETDGAASVWSAVRDLGAQRIGHGIRSSEDPALLAYLRDHRIPLELSITSNVCTGVVATLDAHPIRALVDAGVAVTINTDDPAYFYTTLTKEIGLAASRHGFTLDELADLQGTAIDSSFADRETVVAFRQELDAWRVAGS